MLLLLLNIVRRRLERRGKSLEDFDYSNGEIVKEIKMAMNATNFVGVSVRCVVLIFDYCNTVLILHVLLLLAVVLLLLMNEL